MTPERPPSAAQRWGPRLAVLGAGALLVQIALALFGLVYLSTADVDRAVRVYAPPHPLQGAAAPLRVVAYERHSGRPLPGLTTRALIEQDEDTTPVGLRALGAREDALHGVARIDTPATLHVEVALRPGEVRTLRQPLVPTPGRDMLGEANLWRGRAGTRGAGTVIGTAEEPGVRWDDPPGTSRTPGAEDGSAPMAPLCPWRVTPTAMAGPPARFVTNRVLLYFADESGAPRAGVAVRFEPLDVPSGAALQRTSDALGLVELTRRPEDVERWLVRWDCEGVPAERTLRIVPSWTGIGLDAATPMVSDGGRPTVEIEQQRAWGHWHLTLHCGGIWVFADALPVRQGRSTLEPAPGRVGLATDGLRICRFGASASPHRPDERGLWLVWHDPGFDEGAVIEAVLARFASLGPRTGVSIPDVLRRAVHAAPPDAQRRFVGFLLSLPPPPQLRLPVLVDDQQDAVAAFERTRDTQAARLIAVIALSLLLLIAGIAAFGWPALQARRRALARVMEEIEEEDPSADAEGLVDERRALLALAFAVAAILGFALAMATLFSVMR